MANFKYDNLGQIPMLPDPSMSGTGDYDLASIIEQLKKNEKTRGQINKLFPSVNAPASEIQMPILTSTTIDPNTLPDAPINPGVGMAGPIDIGRPEDTVSHTMSPSAGQADDMFGQATKRFKVGRAGKLLGAGAALAGAAYKASRSAPNQNPSYVLQNPGSDMVNALINPPKGPVIPYAPGQDPWSSEMLQAVVPPQPQEAKPISPSDTSVTKKYSSESSRPVVSSRPQEDFSDSGIVQELNNDRMDRAMQNRDDQAMYAGLGKAGSQLAESIAGLGAGAPVKLDKSMFDQQLERSGLPVTDLKTKQADILEQSKIADLQNARNPESKMSKLYRDLAREVVPNLAISDSMSANDFEKLGLNLSSMYNMKMQNETNRELAHERKQLRSEEKEEKDKFKSDKELNNFIERAQRDVSKSKEYTRLNEFNNRYNQVLSNLKDPSAVKDIGSLYGLVKGFDPDSVVRESELRLAGQTSSLWGDIQRQMTRLGGAKSVRAVPSGLIPLIEQYMRGARGDIEKGYVNFINSKKHQLEKRGAAWDDHGPGIDPNFAYTNKIRQKMALDEEIMKLKEKAQTGKK